MGKRVSPVVIGAFVVASFAFLVVALIVVGSGRMFTKPVRFICMFSGNLNGLKIGAPVKVRGVQIGTVAAIRLRLDPSEGQLRPNAKGFRLPVIIDVDSSMLTSRGATRAALGEAGFKDFIKRGTRAQLGKLCTGGCAERLAESGHNNRVQRWRLSDDWSCDEPPRLLAARGFLTAHTWPLLGAAVCGPDRD
jgi:hypothetical protein